MPLTKNEKQELFDWIIGKIPNQAFDFDKVLKEEKDFKDTVDDICQFEDMKNAKRKVLLSIHLAKDNPKLLQAIQLNLRYVRPNKFGQLPESSLTWTKCNALLDPGTDLGGSLENVKRFNQQKWNQAHNGISDKATEALMEYDSNRKNLRMKAEKFLENQQYNITVLHTCFTGIGSANQVRQTRHKPTEDLYNDAKDKLNDNQKTLISKRETSIIEIFERKKESLDKFKIGYQNLKMITDQIVHTVKTLCLADRVLPDVAAKKKISLEGIEISDLVTISECMDLIHYCERALSNEFSIGKIDKTIDPFLRHLNLLNLSIQTGTRRLSSQGNLRNPSQFVERGGGERFDICVINHDDEIIFRGTVVKDYKEIATMLGKEDDVRKKLENAGNNVWKANAPADKVKSRPIAWMNGINKILMELTGEELNNAETKHNGTNVHAEEIWMFLYAKDLYQNLSEKIDKIKRIEILSTLMPCGAGGKNCRIRIHGRILKLLKKLKEGKGIEDEIEVILFTFKDDENSTIGNQLAYKVSENDGDIDLDLLSTWQDDDQRDSASTSASSASASQVFNGLKVIFGRNN